MAISKPIAQLISDPDGTALQTFLTASPESWAAEHFGRRYGQALPTEEELQNASSVAARCYRALLEEFTVLRGWFTPEGTLSPLQMAPFLASLRNKPVADGLGWDFTASGEAQLLMQQFKGQLIFCQRAALDVPLHSRTQHNLQFAGLMRLVRSAYGNRADLHSWRPRLKRKDGREVVELTGAELSRRWVAFRSYTFMIQVGCDPHTSWLSCKCHDVFGHVDEDLSTGVRGENDES
jgi:hypothetical protein